MPAKIQPLEKKLEITVDLARKLIADQFPEFSHLSIKAVPMSGHDNRTFCLGDDMLMRLPSAASYALKVPKEQEWLPKLSSHISCAIPRPLALGQPSNEYPWSWSIYSWIEGESANACSIEDSVRELIALDLAVFLRELRQIHVSLDACQTLAPGLHNWWRGDHVSVYDEQARTQISVLHNIIDANVSLSLWERAMSSSWYQDPVWVHGDVAPGNILLKNDKLTGVIDFGGMGVGDPACDLVIAWTFFKEESRTIFKEQMAMDEDTWARARGWALWKASYELCCLADKEGVDAMKQRAIIYAILNEHEN